ncbi:polysaccharide deacetylase family protein [Algicola sagamiensis]|uniref:polysaccharide deacetylase family protein n=1 Tax=Algicola sagamiensis TaxID=163869 RepID=UPI0003A4511C|nr:polysaccharide deacetylase family protein [Algicola sagamiensis]
MRIFLTLGILFSLSAYAAGPKKVATLDRSTWPKAIQTPQAFDEASRFENLMFALALNQVPTKVKDIRDFTKLRRIHEDNVALWKAKTQHRIMSNYDMAAHSCVRNSQGCYQASNWEDFVKAAQTWKLSLPNSSYRTWAMEAEAFYRTYAFEQARLAALSPKITSEIETFSAAEITGHEMADKTFLLTFDDGPYEKYTKPLVKDLNQMRIQALFFVMGEKIKGQSESHLRGVYQNQCVGSHSFEHKSLPKEKEWDKHLQETKAEILNAQLSNTKEFWFRPPYGQRTQEQLDWLESQKDRVMLWNIDSQDWQKKLTDKEVQDRVVTLMLLWRKGIILFHDIHPKAGKIVPALENFRLQAQFNWASCRDF